MKASIIVDGIETEFDLEFEEILSLSKDVALLMETNRTVCFSMTFRKGEKL